MVHTKKDAIKIVTNSAEKYDIELKGRNLLLVCMDKHERVSTIELSFFGWGFLHLTGLKLRDDVNLTPDSFYDACLNHKLSQEDFEFSPDGTTGLKLDVLPYVICKNLSANSIGDYSGRGPVLHTEKLAGGQKACIGFVKSDMIGGYVPNTLLRGDIRDYTKNNRRIIAIFRKYFNECDYQEITYLAKKVKWNDLSFPNEYEELRQKILMNH